MKFTEILTESPVRIISPQQAVDADMFGPVYHGTNADINSILSTGFNPKFSVPSGISRFNRPTGPSNGYEMDHYAHGMPAPIHHLGFGTYFTTIKNIAKQFNGYTTKGLKTFYINSGNILEINFGSRNTMMQWWRDNGYYMSPEDLKNKNVKAWIKATGILTRNLRSQYDAVWYKGKGLYRLLDGDQICVYNSKLICLVNPKLASGLEVGAKVVHSGVNRYRGRNDIYIDDLNINDFRNAGALAGNGWKGLFRATDHEGKDILRTGQKTPSGEHIGNYPIHFIPPSNIVGVIVKKTEVPEEQRKFNNGDKFRYEVKWSKGGTMYNYSESELKPYETV
jgi:hypothetical protein